MPETVAEARLEAQAPGRQIRQTRMGIQQGAAAIAIELQGHGVEREVTPGQVIEMTMKSHHFLFQCEMTSNVANRTSDGIQQLFRQQS